MNSPSIIIYRIGNWFHTRKMKPVGLLFSYLNRVLFSTWVPSSIKAGKRFKLGYWGLGIVIHHNCVIGDRVTVAHNVTIGRNFGDRSVPVIGDDVYIGTGSVVFGSVKIGNNVIIGSNTVVNKDIQDNCTVVGNPFRIIATNRVTKYYEIDDITSS